MSSQHSQLEFCKLTRLPLCRRAFNINLALGYTEEFYSLKALAEMHSMTLEELFDYAYAYIERRDCFIKEWKKMTESSECPLPEDCAIHRCFAC